ncbi:MAG TPA: hypothetical protein GX693_00855 [Firmicutes bacterium]|nr:hypothetical protein [Bacillota bacterium]
MTYGIGISFPTEPTEEDIKKLKRELTKDKFEVVEGKKTKIKAGKAKSKGR